MSNAKQTAAAGPTLPSAPFPFSKLQSAGLQTALLRGECVYKEALERVIKNNQPKRFSPLRWAFGGQAYLELCWPNLHANAAHKLHAAWLRACEARLAKWNAEIGEVFRGGSKAERTVNGWLSHLCEQATSQMGCWTPFMDRYEDIVFPPSVHNTSSQELDNLLVTDHAVYVIEVKSWHEVNANGGRVLADGTELGSPLAQSRMKVEHLRKILGQDVQVKAIAVLPNLKDEDIPFELDTRIVTSLGQLSLMLRDGQQRAKSGGKLDVSAVGELILQAMNTSKKAKIEHMRWLAETRPNEDALRVRELDDKMIRMQEEMAEPLVFERQQRSTIASLMSLLIPVGIFLLGKYKDSAMISSIVGG